MFENSPHSTLDHTLIQQLQQKTAMLWLNPYLGCALPNDAPSVHAIQAAQDRLQRSQALLQHLFPELAASQGQIESDLIALNQAEPALFTQPKLSKQAIYLKADHALPIAGSIKARGGFHEVIAIAEQIALEQQLITAEQDLLALSTASAKACFAEYTISVGSTGNLGLSIGIMAAALGFKAVVHMSVEAKEWKKQRLRDRGVEVVEHRGDYAAAVAGGRAEAATHPKCHFVDDEQSTLLFLGYAAAATHLAQQLQQQQRQIDREHPLIVYIPCGVGGAPGGICYGLKAIFGDAVHCFFAEPVASPCMLVQLAANTDQAVSVYDIGLDNKTEADGLAVGLASTLVSPLMRAQLSGVFTVEDPQLYQNLYQLKHLEQIEVEPSAAAALQGPVWLNHPAAQDYLNSHNIVIAQATHVIWSTGGCLVPQQEMQKFQRIGQEIYDRHKSKT
ncbi:D-serine ammonia-lyase [Acinetobacter larvae]|uniref:Probable D-serine dehydratase n=1 Tax=Acinetobacter larvae TaxID=1789224 RepID=A0A1B2LZQ8_9GAMM|nr:D-serine ammonia-lyase [Acinetobacter larvae]AOA58391.1 D-serine ammonia-lyase [Acinetobacter larvae]